ncbi:hypothetical protein, partial [Burkholderia territorii]|uniref:hypothetical protein n=1 Tax=Burkholderia territorii TaxID=1503055 RepID=UPI001BAB480C
RCAIACAWCVVRPPRGQAAAARSRMPRIIEPSWRVARSLRAGWHATRFIDAREVRSNLHHLQDR